MLAELTRGSPDAVPQRAADRRKRARFAVAPSHQTSPDGRRSLSCAHQARAMHPLHSRQRPTHRRRRAAPPGPLSATCRRRAFRSCRLARAALDRSRTCRPRCAGRQRTSPRGAPPSSPGAVLRATRRGRRLRPERPAGGTATARLGAAASADMAWTASDQPSGLALSLGLGVCDPIGAFGHFEFGLVRLRVVSKPARTPRFMKGTDPRHPLT